MTMDIAVLGLEVKSDSVKTASRDLDGLQKSSAQAETATGKLTSSFTQYAGAIRAVAGAYGLMKVSQYIYEAATLSARYTTLGVVLHRVGENAGYSSGQMDEYASKLRETGISAIESRSALTRLTQAHIDLSKSSELARLAQDAAVIGNINSSEAFGRLVYGIQSAQVEVLRTIGLNVNFEAGYKRLAKELGITTEALTEQQKVQARVQEVMKAGTAISGVYSDAMDTAGKKMSSLARYAEDAKVEVGKLFEPALATGIDVATASLKEANRVLIDMNSILAAMPTVAGTASSALRTIIDAIDPTGAALGGLNALANSVNYALGLTYDFFLRPWVNFAGGLYDGLVETGREAERARSSFEHLAKAGDMVERALGWSGKKIVTPSTTTSTGEAKSHWLTVEELQKRASKAQATAWAARMGTGDDGGIKDLARYNEEEAAATAALEKEYDALRQTMRDLGTEETFASKQAKELQAALETASRESARSWEAGATKALQDYADEATNTAAQTERAFRTAFRAAEDYMVQFVQTGKLSFSDLANSITADLIRMGTQQAITGPIAASMSGWDLGSMFAGIFHEGGVVGQTAAPTRAVDPGIFVGAPRLHSGLASDEYPAILQRGEAVIPRGGSAEKTSRTEIVIQNAPAGTKEVSRESNSSGGERIILQLGSELARQDIGMGGPLSKTLEAKYGLTPVGRR